MDEYFDVVKNYYGGKVSNLDFTANTEKSRLTINDWVAEQTNNKIPKLLENGAIDEDTRLVLTNAVYFKGMWVKAFNEDETEEADFNKSDRETVKVDMMQRVDDESEFKYAEAEDVQILEMDYKGDDLSMLVLLPSSESNINTLENILTTEKLSEWKDQLEEQRVDVYMPKFKFETKYNMLGTLSAMGMPTAFSKDADFSGMTGEKELYVDKVIHQAVIEVNEEGTEAAAATGVVVEMKFSEDDTSIPKFRADHPFIFVIQQKDTGNILFIGRVTDPGQE